MSNILTVQQEKEQLSHVFTNPREVGFSEKNDGPAPSFQSFFSSHCEFDEEGKHFIAACLVLKSVNDSQSYNSPFVGSKCCFHCEHTRYICGTDGN